MCSAVVRRRSPHSPRRLNDSSMHLALFDIDWQGTQQLKAAMADADLVIAAIVVGIAGAGN